MSTANRKIVFAMVALATMVFCAAGANEDRALIRRNVKWLESAQVQGDRENAKRGGWAYGPRLGSGDGSNTRFALLALDAAERAGVKAGRQTWHAALDYWLRSQKADGSWGYIPGQQSTGSMTGRKQLGDHDWHAEGTRRLLAAQDLIDGRWIGRGQVERNPLIATSFAILFLASKPAGN